VNEEADRLRDADERGAHVVVAVRGNYNWMFFALVQVVLQYELSYLSMATLTTTAMLTSWHCVVYTLYLNQHYYWNPIGRVACWLDEKTVP
jgi:hypothetical protein